MNRAQERITRRKPIARTWRLLESGVERGMKAGHSGGVLGCEIGRSSGAECETYKRQRDDGLEARGHFGG